MRDLEKMSIWKTILRTMGRTVLTIGFIATAGAAVVFAQGFLVDRANAVPQPSPALPTPVSTHPVVHEDSYSTERAFLGQIEPRSSVDLSFELSGLMTELFVTEGEHVEQGDRIAILDTALLEAEQKRLEALRSATEAQLIFAQTRVDRAENLQQRGFTSIEARDQATALRDELQNKIAETDAALRAIEINLTKSVLYAPISGRVSEQLVDAAETVSPGQTIVVILETSAPEFRVGLPLSVNPDDVTAASVQVGSDTFPARLVQLRPDIDPVTRTRTAIFSLSQTEGIVFGQTASLVVEIKTSARGFWVELGALKQGDGSVWTVLAVDDKNMVRPAVVEVIHAEQDHVFVKGSLQDGDTLVAKGAHRVVPGQTVRLAQGGTQ